MADLITNPRRGSGPAPEAGTSATPPPLPNDGSLENLRLRERYAEIAQLAGGLAHEIRNPLSTMSLNLDLLAEEFQHPESTREKRIVQKIDRLRRESQRLQDILENFLRYARVQEPRLETTDLNVVVEELRDFFEPTAMDQNIVIRTQYESDLPRMSLDSGLFRQALLNLFINARHALPDGGELLLRTRSEGPWNVLEVTDTGVGMSEDVRDHVFDPFYTTRARQRSGLEACPPCSGSSRRIAARSPFRASRAKGRSSSSAFPITGRTPNGRRTIRTARPMDQQIRVLVVDDDEPHAEAVAESLERVGYDCVVANSGRTALRMIEEQTFDLVVTDLIMDGVGGLEVLAKAKRELPDCEVVILTGQGTIMTAVTAMQAGATTYLTKPLDINELRAVADKVSQTQRLARSNIELQRQLNERFGFEGVIGNSPLMHSVVSRLRQIALPHMRPSC